MFEGHALVPSGSYAKLAGSGSRCEAQRHGAVLELPVDTHGSCTQQEQPGELRSCPLSGVGAPNMEWGCTLPTQTSNGECWQCHGPVPSPGCCGWEEEGLHPCQLPVRTAQQGRPWSLKIQMNFRCPSLKEISGLKTFI